ncbi:hypothetical protein NDN08_001909 [Rhodosorus marinus]|uniref:Uncharacterized protein n=1 Tax=Rhodosorus marinus TaxID=101924 RepID=A0AAV8UVV6_9RHOD|nr:hypothetical protein NDN08_001909 [Rhodosorus marinus]
MVKKAAEHDGLTPEERELMEEAKRLKEKGVGHLRRTESSRTNRVVPSALRHSHGCDIVKKNTPKKLKYLVCFPGAVSLPQEGKIGEIQGLHTPLPSLAIEYKTFKVILRGTFVQPKNAVFTMKGASALKGSVLIRDVFQALLVFSEWEIEGKEGFESSAGEHLLWKSPEQKEDPVEDTEAKEEVKDIVDVDVDIQRSNVEQTSRPAPASPMIVDGMTQDTQATVVSPERATAEVPVRSSRRQSSRDATERMRAGEKKHTPDGSEDEDLEEEMDEEEDDDDDDEDVEY